MPPTISDKPASHRPCSLPLLPIAPPTPQRGEGARPIRVLALCDTPTVRPPGIPGAQATTGFATVGKNLFQRWTAAGVPVATADSLVGIQDQVAWILSNYPTNGAPGAPGNGTNYVATIFTNSVLTSAQFTFWDWCAGTARISTSARPQTPGNGRR